MEDRLLKVRDYLDAHATRRVRLRELAAAIRISRWHLVRSFKSRFGIAPYAYLKSVRITRAKMLLQAGMPPSRVAHEVGFSDHSHLSRQFREVVGVTPDRFRRMHAAESAQSPAQAPHRHTPFAANSSDVIP